MTEYIEREAAIAVIYGQHVGGKEACENARPNTYGADLREIVADIEDIPAADVVPVQRWIPVTERLPERRRSVLVYCPRYKNTYTAFLDDDGGWVHFGGPIYAVSNTVTHWMPLPTPPKEETE